MKTKTKVKACDKPSEKEKAEKAAYNEAHKR